MNGGHDTRFPFSVTLGPGPARRARKSLAKWTGGRGRPRMEARVEMSRSGRLVVLAACLAAMPVLAPRPARAQGFAPGRVVERVVCFADPGRSYALFLPSSFDPRKTWPVLILFDAAARGPVAIEAFRDAAETYGWILAGSNDSRNGPLRESGLAAAALWADLRVRVPVDVRRIYASGFSGGSRVASMFSRFVDRPIAGVIGCGAGLASGVEPGALEAAAYFGLAGLRDFNYGEMKALDLSFDPTGLPHRFQYFEGPHSWPDPAACARAVAWMEVLAMKQGLRPADPALAAALVGRDLEEARALEAAGRVYWAADLLEAAARMAEGMNLDVPGLTGLDGRIAGLKSRKEYGKFLEAERKRDRKSGEFREELSRAFGSVEDPESGGAAAVPKILREMGIGFLRKEAQGKGTVEDRALASRLLFDFAFAARTRAQELFEKGDLRRTGAYLDLAIAACEEGLAMAGPLHYGRSCVAARVGDKGLALRHLALAVDTGFADLELLETDKDLDRIRDTEAFREILERVRTAREPGKTGK